MTVHAESPHGERTICQQVEAQLTLHESLRTESGLSAIKLRHNLTCGISAQRADPSAVLRHNLYFMLSLLTEMREEIKSRGAQVPTPMLS